MTKKWIVTQPKRREPMLIHPITNLGYGHSSAAKTIIFGINFSSSPEVTQSPEKRNKVGENHCIAYRLTEK